MKQFFKMTFATVAGIILFMVIMGILFATWAFSSP